MKHPVWLAMGFTMLSCLITWSSVSEAPGPLEPAYLEQTNGMFAVCAFDRAKGKLIQYKGVFISKSQLPPVSVMEPNLIFALGSEPQPLSDAPAAWNPQPEDLYHYGRIPYPVEKIDPSLELCRTEQAEIAVGFRLRGRFFAVKNLGKMEGYQSNEVAVHESKGRLQILWVEPPKHRESDIRDFVRKVESKN